MTKYVLIPEYKLKELEEARLRLWNLYPEASIEEIINLTPISEVMWYIANRKWETYVKP